MRWEPHVRFGERAGKTDQRERWHCVPARLHHKTTAACDMRHKGGRHTLHQRRQEGPHCVDATAHRPWRWGPVQIEDLEWRKAEHAH
jgi:hypothetical protein